MLELQGQGVIKILFADLAMCAINNTVNLNVLENKCVLLL